MPSSLKVQLPAALLAGLLFGMGLAPFDWWGATLVSIALFFLLLLHARERAGLLALAYGLGKYGFGASWVYVSIHVYGNAPPPLAVFMVALFTLTTAVLFVWPLGFAYRRLHAHGDSWRALFLNALTFTGLWMLTYT